VNSTPLLYRKIKRNTFVKKAAKNIDQSFSLPGKVNQFFSKKIILFATKYSYFWQERYKYQRIANKNSLIFAA
jgi:hypothetical protein